MDGSPTLRMAADEIVTRILALPDDDPAARALRDRAARLLTGGSRRDDRTIHPQSDVVVVN